MSHVPSTFIQFQVIPGAARDTIYGLCTHGRLWLRYRILDPGGLWVMTPWESLDESR